jgi:predicted nucleotide-binding protein
VKSAFDDEENHFYCAKSVYKEDRFAEFLITEVRRAQEMTVPLRPFIVHGHDDAARWALKNYLQNTIGTEEPIVLGEQPAGGLTVIEWFEKHAAKADVVLALFTPDDSTVSGDKRARENVIFEFGYFVGHLGPMVLT